MAKLRSSLLLLGPIFLGIAAARDHIQEQIEFPELMFDAMLWLGLACFGLALVMYLLAAMPRPATVIYTSRPVKLTEIDDVYSLIQDMLGDGIAPKEMLKRWLRKNSTVLYVVEKTTRMPLNTRSEVVGFFSSFPVTEKARQMLETNALIGAAFTDEHFVAQGEPGAAIYIGAVGAKGMKARGATLNQLIGHVTAKAGGRGMRIFTRPVTADARRLIRKYSFAPCAQASAGAQPVNYYFDLPASEAPVGNASQPIPAS